MRGSIRRRGKGTWEIAVELGVDPVTGKRRRRTRNVKGTRRDADREHSAMLHALATGTYVDATRETVGGYLERWLRDHARSVVAPRTYERYEGIVRMHLVPALGTIKLAQLRPGHIVTAERQWRESGNLRNGGELAPRTVLHHHRVLREALQQAVKWQLLTVNPADAVSPPRVETKEMKVLDARQAKALLHALKGQEFEVAILTALHTGLRLSELLGLRWSDADLTTGRLAVQQNLQRRKGGGFASSSTKTHRSRRGISMPEVVTSALRDHRQAQLQQRLLTGPPWVDGDLIFTDPIGRPISPERLRVVFKRTLKEEGLPCIRLHDLRHTMATLMLAQGEHPKIVSERLGHATVGITLDTYSHVLPGLQAAAAENLARSIAEASDHSPAPQ